MKRVLLTLILLSVLTGSALAQVSPVPPLMNFQGRLAKPDGTPVSDGTYSVRFSLWDAATNGTEKWNQTIATVSVHNGTFAALLSGFSADTFNGNLWLEIKIGTDAPLTPRQQLVSVAYAMKANSVPDGSIGTAQIAAGSITADKFASNLLNPLVWLLGGNSGVTGGFLGTTDNQPLVFKVNNRRAMQYQYAEALGLHYRSINVLGGNEVNSIAADVVGATIAGGGLVFPGSGNPPLSNQVLAHFGTVGGGAGNIANGNFATVGGGQSNTAGDFATVGGGVSNTASGFIATVGGGLNNTASSSYATVGGGQENGAGGENATVGGGGANKAIGGSSTVGGGLDNTASGAAATVGGGVSNSANGNYATVGGGQQNNAAGESATVAGGQFNSASDFGTVGGGSGNAAGVYATVAGGYLNDASGNFSFAAGQKALIGTSGTFVWNDGSIGFFASTGANQFLIHAIGGIGINTNDPAGYALNVNGTANFAGSINVNGTTYTSDARYKQHITTFDNALDAILNLRGVTFDWNRDAWREKNFPEGRQVGFIAQEVEKVLPELVTTDRNGYKSVAYANVVPILVEAVKTQQKQMETQNKKVETLGKENAELKARLAAIEQALAELKVQRK